MTDSENKPTGFSGLDLIEPIHKALEDVGYETPSPIQALTIPLILAGKDVLGQAQTGTGKTAAFALPLLSRLDPEAKHVQVLVLTPTRELAIQVAEAFQRYAVHMRDFRVLPVYGGQAYDVQLRKLSRGVDVVVGTPGRVMDHMRRRTLKLDSLNCLVLDEADEMLRMGFIDDVEWILEQTPKGRQVALFSATIPAAIRRIAQQHLNDPEQVTIKVKTTTADTIRQRFWAVSGFHKLDALTRILEAEPFEAMIIFVRTKTATAELAEKLGARGFAAAPISGDISQQMRERTIERLRKGQLDILVATDVAARGLDVDRVSHVVNYDIPYDTDSYVHRVGRTGRAGRIGEAILFVAPRERRLLYAIEQATRQKIERMELPSTEVINDRRMILFKQRITDTLAAEEWQVFTPLLEQYQQEHNVPAMEIASALARLVQGDAPLLLTPQPVRRRDDRSFKDGGFDRDRGPRNFRDRDRGPRSQGDRDRGPRSQGDRDFPPRGHGDRDRGPRRPPSQPEAGMERYRVEVGRSHGLQPGNLVGAIANEGGLEGRHIGRIDIFDHHSTVDLPEGMPHDVFRALQATWVSGQKLRIGKLADGPSGGGSGDGDRGGAGGGDRPRPRGPGGPGGPRGPRGPRGPGRPGGPGGPKGPRGAKGFGGRDGSQPRKKRGPGGPKKKPGRKF